MSCERLELRRVGTLGFKRRVQLSTNSPMELRGYKEIPGNITEWMGGSEFWVACAWHHLTHQTYMGWQGLRVAARGTEPAKGLISFYSCPVDPSINLVLDAWIRFFDVWEP